MHFKIELKIISHASLFCRQTYIMYLAISFSEEMVDNIHPILKGVIILNKA